MASFVNELRTDFPIRLENPHVIDKKQVWVGVVPKGPGGAVLNSSYKTRSDDRYLTDLYGDWRTPMVNFDTVISWHHLVGFPDVVRCFAYSRLALALTEGRRDRSLAYVAQILVKDPLDPVSNRIRNLLAAQQGKEHG